MILSFLIMNSFFYYLESEFKEQYNLKFIYKENRLIIKNRYYLFNLKKINDYYELFYLWKLGLLSILFYQQYKNMRKLYKAINIYSKKNKILITEIHYYQYIKSFYYLL